LLIEEEKTKFLVTGVVIRNFKSVESVEFDLAPGVNVLVGANASGKTNILEAISFLYKALIDAAQRAPYRPHIPYYWNALDLVYMRDPSRRVDIGLKGIYYWVERSGKRFSIRVYFEARFMYNQAEDTLEPVEYYVGIGNVEITFSREYITVKQPLENIKLIKSYLEKKRSLPDFLLETMYLRTRDTDSRAWLKLFLDKVEENDKYATYRVSTLGMPIKPFIPWNIPSYLFEEDHRELRGHLLVFEDFAFLEDPLVYVLKPSSARDMKGALINRSYRRRPSFTEILFSVVPSVIKRIVFSRHPDIGVIRKPYDFLGSDHLRERAENLADVLLTLQAKQGGLPELVVEALKECFPGVSIRLEPGLGKVALVGEEDGLRLNPPNLPDGLIKLVALMTAASLRPSILLVDELENSMHARLLEYVIDVFNSLDNPVLIATHSPLVVDLVDPERVLVAVKERGRGTKVSRAASREDLMRRLSKLGVALSDYVMYYLSENE